jgi:hypothetical protein
MTAILTAAGARPATAQTTLVSQSRTIELQATASNPGGSPSTDALTVTAPDAGPFDVDRSVMISSAGGSGSARATQVSTLAADRITGSGSTSSSANAAYSAENLNSGSGGAMTRMTIVFDVLQTVAYSATGALTIDVPGANPYLGLSRDGVPVFSVFPPGSFGTTPIQRSGVLTPGRYTLIASADAFTSATTFWYFTHRSSFTFTFTMDPVSAPFCFGDASGTACPCGNDSAIGADVGCLNSTGRGGELRAGGVPSLANDSLVLSGAQMTGTAALFFQGTTQENGGNGAVFGDGKRCAAGTIARLGTQANAGGSSQYPVGADLPISVRGSVVAPGTRTYQAWYRNVTPFCTPSGFNLTNGVVVHWQP